MDAAGTKAQGGMEAVPEAGLPPPVGEGLAGTTKGECHSFPCCVAPTPSVCAAVGLAPAQQELEVKLWNCALWKPRHLGCRAWLSTAMFL